MPEPQPEPLSTDRSREPGEDNHRDDPSNTRRTDGTAGRELPAGAARRSWTGGDLLALLVVLLAAVLVRGIYIGQQRSSPDFDYPTVDAEFFDTWARDLAEGRQFTDQPYYRAPLFPWMLGITYKLFGTGALAWRIVHIILGAMTCGLIFTIGRLAFSRTVGLVAGLGTATYWILVYYTGEMLIPTLAVLLNVLLVVTLYQAQRRQRLALWGLAGFVLGLSAIARPNVLLFAPAVVVWIIALRWRGPPWRPADSEVGRYGWPVGTVAVFALACLVPVLPVTIRNYLVGHDRVLISSQAGVNLYIGNNAQADGYNVLLPGTRPHWRDTCLDQIAIAERAEGRKLKPSEVSVHYLERTWDFVSSRPGDALSLLFTKLKLFWNAHEFANNKDIQDYTRRYTPVVRYLPLTFGMVAPLGLLGVVVSWPRRRELFPLWGFVLVYMVSVVLFFVSARFRVPVLPVLILYAAVAVEWMVRTLARRRWRPVIEALLLLGLLALFSNAGQPYKSMPGSWEVTSAAMLAQEGELDRAIAKYREAIAQSPDNFEAHGQLALVYVLEGDLGSAERSARRAVTLNPNYAKGHDTLGAALAQQGRVEDALRHFQRSVELVPHDAGAQRHLGSALLVAGRFAEADRHFRRANELEPGRADTLASLGLVAARQGDAAAAVERFRESASIDAANPDVYVQWAGVLQSQGRAAGAVDVLRQGLEQLPDNNALTIRLAQVLLGSRDPAVRDPAEAVWLAETVCERDRRTDPQSLHTLAVAYALTGRCDDATREARRALPLAEQRGLKPVVQQLRTLIQGCESGQPLNAPEAPTSR